MHLIDQLYPSKRFYLDTPEGQLHTRRFGDPAGRPIVLLHWTPGSGAQLAHVAHALGARGYDVLAPDMFGFGTSAHPDPTTWTQVRHGAALAQGLRDLGLSNIAIHGGHMGGEVAMETAMAAPDIVVDVILDGIASDWTVETRLDMISKFSFEPPAYEEAGAPVTHAWSWTHNLWKVWAPTLAFDGAWDATLHQAAIDFMQTGMAGGPMRTAFGNYNALDRLPDIKQPVLALTADSDTLRSQFPTTVRALKDVRGHVFEGTHPCHRPDGGEAYADIVSAYLEGTPHDWLSKTDDLEPKAALNQYEEQEG
ncbi:MAG: alpha/beta fold hydrolase [Sphingomonadales bacterium]